VVSILVHNAAAKTSSRSVDMSPGVRQRLSELDDEDWARFAQEWRNSYKKFTKGFKPGETVWRDIDTHHHLSLQELLKKWQIEGMYTVDEVRDLSRIWHFLDPWSDSSSGVQKLGTKFVHPVKWKSGIAKRPQ